MNEPAFLITIDTEGDNLWARPRKITTHNAEYLPRFQTLCEKYGLKPTYLVDWDMVRCAEFIAFGRKVLHDGQAEIGMHLHAWNTPPIVRLTDDDFRYSPYLIEYPVNVIQDKVACMTQVLRHTFDVCVRSHRAGRWAFDHRYAAALVDNGYSVDCSVTPHVSWADQMGDPNRGGGVDYRHFPRGAYFVDLNDISRKGASELLELPMTVVPHYELFTHNAKSCLKVSTLLAQLRHRYRPRNVWLRPKRDNLNDLLAVLKWAQDLKRPYVEFMLHSSELMPGGSPAFPRHADIERLYTDLECLFATATQFCSGKTLTEYCKDLHVMNTAQNLV